MGFKVSCSQDLTEVISKYPITSLTIDEFIEYKQECIDYDDVPAPPIHVQVKHPAHIETIGRDKLMERPTESRAEELHHVHIWQEGCVWEDEKGLKVQWNSTSNSYIVYSYFKDKNNDDHFYVIDFCKDKGHDIIEDDAQVDSWTRQAKEFRLKNS